MALISQKGDRVHCGNGDARNHKKFREEPREAQSTLTALEGDRTGHSPETGGTECRIMFI